MPEQPRSMNSTSSSGMPRSSSSPGVPTSSAADGTAGGSRRGRGAAPAAAGAGRARPARAGTGPAPWCGPATSSASRSSVSLHVFVAEHQRRRRLRADDRVAVADGVGQDAEIGQGVLARMIDVADDQRGHPRAPLPGGDVDVHPGVAEDRDGRLGQLLVVVVGEEVDEVDHPRAGLLRARLVEPQPRPASGERRPPDAR